MSFLILQTYLNLNIKGLNKKLLPKVIPVSPVVLHRCALGNWTQIQFELWSLYSNHDNPIPIPRPEQVNPFNSPGDILELGMGEQAKLAQYDWGICLIAGRREYLSLL